jgi:hypothetical protein
MPVKVEPSIDSPPGEKDSEHQVERRDGHDDQRDVDWRQQRKCDRSDQQEQGQQRLAAAIRAGDRGRPAERQCKADDG